MLREKPSKSLSLVCCFLLCSLFILAGCATKTSKVDFSKADLVILHTNDTHAHIAGIDENGSPCMDDAKCRGGLARVAYAIKEAKKHNKNVLALDAGDMFQGTLFFTNSGWKMTADLNKLVPWDANTFGNHEWDLGCGELAKYLMENKSFPTLAANLTPEKGCPLWAIDVPKKIVREIGGHKVGIIGLANDEVLGLASACSKTKFADRIKTVQKEVSELEKQGVNRIILVTHIGLPDDLALARSVNGVDVIVGGHTHSYIGPGSKEGPYPCVEHAPNGNPVLVVTAKRATQYLGELACNFDANGVLTSWSGGPHELLPSDPRDPAVSQKVKEYADALAKFQAQKIGILDSDLGPDGLDACREAECQTGMIVTDAMLDYGRSFGAQMAIFNGGGVRAAFPKGELNLGHLLTAFPFNNQILVREYSGEQIWEALEHGVAKPTATGPELLQVSGLSYVVDASKPKGQRVSSIQIIDPKGKTKPLRLKSKYRVVVPEFLVQGGDFFDMLKTGKTVSTTSINDIGVLRNYFQKHSHIHKVRVGRIIRK